MAQINEIPDVLFPSDNELEIPSLRLDMQAKYCEIPFLAFGEQKRTYNMNNTGTLHFYVDDYRFSAIYEHPSKILQHKPANIVEPNYSTYYEMPISFGLQNIYKKRWIARTMQERGIRVFVDLNVAQKFYALNMMGVPRGWSSFCTRGYSEQQTNLEFEFNLAREWAGDNQLLFVIYGGGRACRNFAQRHGCVYVSPCVTTKKKVEAIKQLHEGTMFLGEEFKLPQLEANTHQTMQVHDFTDEPTLITGMSFLELEENSEINTSENED